MMREIKLTTPQTLGERIRYLRKVRQFNQMDLAILCHLTPMEISRYECDRNVPRAQMLCKLADVFDCSVDFLLGRTQLYSPPYTSRVDYSSDDVVSVLEKETQNDLC